MNPKTTSNTVKYLQQYSNGIDLSFCQEYFNQCLPWQNVVIIPACGETAHFLDDVFDNVKGYSVLVVLIVNRPDEHAKTNLWFEKNNKLINRVKKNAKQDIQSAHGHHLLINKSGIDCLLLDFNSDPFPKQEGVGLARKIAADTALELIQRKQIKQPWIFSTDADVKLPADYFDIVENIKPGYSAICLDFQHVSNCKESMKLQKLYDFKLRYYQKGIQYINSCYHYIPLGSTLIVNEKSYVQVRGFPCKSGGEDFYILNKLAKVGHVFQPEKPVIQINIRFSDRVPFGTGPALQKLSDENTTPLFYHPEIFHIIKYWRHNLIDYFKTHTLPVNDCNLNQNWQIRELLAKAIKQYKTYQHWLKFIDDWLDAFKILKSVHFLREQWPSLQMEELMVNHRYRTICGKTSI